MIFQRISSGVIRSVCIKGVFLMLLSSFGETNQSGDVMDVYGFETSICQVSGQVVFGSVNCRGYLKINRACKLLSIFICK